MGGDKGKYNSTLIITWYAVVTKASRLGSILVQDIIIVQVYIIFALPDYSSEVIERHQNVFYERLIPLALEFDIH